LPRLPTVPLKEIAEAAGCSKASASDIRRGKRTPHLSTWAALGRACRACISDRSGWPMTCSQTRRL
jgi:hypothetical protein